MAGTFQYCRNRSTLAGTFQYRINSAEAMMNALSDKFQSRDQKSIGTETGACMLSRFYIYVIDSDSLAIL